MAMMNPDGRPSLAAPRVPRLGRFGMMRQGFRRPPATPGLMGAPNGRPPEGGPMIARGPAVDALRARMTRPALGSDVRPPELQPPLGAALPMESVAQAVAEAAPVAQMEPPDGAPVDQVEELKRKLRGTDMPPAPSAYSTY